MRRFRRLRSNESIRSLVRETRVDKKDLIYPIFVAEGENIKKPVESMPNVYQYSLDRLDEILAEISESSIAGILIFGIPKHKDELASGAYDENGITQQAIRYIKVKYPSMLIIADVCLCEYTSHGHCGVVCGHKILNDETLPLLSRMAVSLAKAGADIIAPSDMMDGRVSAIRNALDENGFADTPILSYSAKFASAYYSPFRDAAESAPEFGDRKSYQMDYANGKEALREIEDDIEEGADMVMVKPALAYLDVVKAARERFDLPLVVYNVSGEYAMVKAAAEKGWIDEKKVVSAHRTPDLMFKHAEEARSRGIKVIIAGAGGAAHLPGMVAAKTTLPVIGVPVKSRALSGVDSLYSIVQMPGGVPVATMAIGEAGATNAALFALRLLSVEDQAIATALADFAEEQGKIAEESTNELN